MGINKWSDEVYFLFRCNFVISSFLFTSNTFNTFNKRCNLFKNYVNVLENSIFVLICDFTSFLLPEKIDAPHPKTVSDTTISRHNSTFSERHSNSHCRMDTVKKPVNPGNL